MVTHIFGAQGLRGLAATLASAGERRTPKTAFATKLAAEKAIPKTARGLHAYRCTDHGRHLGHG